ncbi:MAG TPA: MFS transporter [Devosiaceae bacterium]|jgi:DHA1 family inner membrane transport protein|nr:MFS transporter [Devosiaceae bacterium]
MPLAIYAMALAAFAIGSAEFIVSGILPPLATDLAVSIPAAGMLVTVYAIGVAIGGPVLTVMAARYSPRSIIIAALILFALAQVLCAVAPGYQLLLVARLIAACGHGVFFGAGNVVVARLVPLERRGSAFALFIGGITVANLLGLPGGAAIGNAFGWRAAFVAVAVLGAIATIVILTRVPRESPDAHPRTSLRNQLQALRHQEVFLSFLTIIIIMTAILTFGTYQVPLLMEVTGVQQDLVPLYLLLGGVGSVIGIYSGGRLADWRPMPSLIAVLLLLSLSFGAMLFTMHHPLLMAINLLLGNLFGFAFSTPLQLRIMQAARAAPNLASSLISTSFNIGIASGATLGALLLSSGFRYEHLPWVGVFSGVAAAMVAAFSWGLERRHHRLAA